MVFVFFASAALALDSLESDRFKSAAPFESMSRSASALDVEAREEKSDGFRLGPWGSGGVPRAEAAVPSGIGPASAEARPGYFRNLIGGALGALLAPAAFALEAVQYAALTPVRMAFGAARGEPAALLDPLRLIKNLFFDALSLVLGVVNSLAAPVWGLVDRDAAADFLYANNRLVFIGGPAATLMSRAGIGAAAPSMHAVFMTRRALDADAEHEFVHNRQWADSWLGEKTGHPAQRVRWDLEDAHRYLNW